MNTVLTFSSFIYVNQTLYDALADEAHERKTTSLPAWKKTLLLGKYAVAVHRLVN
jgi:hypothetical protein